nr:hypothetical protein [Candidatus Dependentiae bacterium]
HHAQDQQETFFLRMIRGASIAGLASIRPHQGRYIRPLLKISKAAILEYLTHNKLSWRIDSTNEQDTYLRNAIRLHVLPSLRRCDARFEKNFDATLSHIQETDLFIERLATAAFKRILRMHNEELSIDIALFFTEDVFLHHRLLLMWLCREKVPFTPSTALFNEIVRFLGNKGTTHQLTSHWFLVKRNGCVSLKKGTR